MATRFAVQIQTRETGEQESFWKTTTTHTSQVEASRKAAELATLTSQDIQVVKLAV